MNLLIAILMLLGLHASPEQLTDQRFLDENQSVIYRANSIIDNHDYKEVDGVVIIDEDIT